jgi:hypothetical protein
MSGFAMRYAKRSAERWVNKPKLRPRLRLNKYLKWLDPPGTPAETGNVWQAMIPSRIGAD